MGARPSACCLGSDPADGRSAPLRVLVTGFHDWQNLGAPPDLNLWRSLDNPTSRLLRGPTTDPGQPLPFDCAGPLACKLREGHLAASVRWSFLTLATCWGTSNSVDYRSYDVVIHLGLGVYDCYDTIHLEDGATNSRKSARDAAGLVAPSTIDPAAPNVLEVPSCGAVCQGLDGLEVSPGFTVRCKAASPHNTYICNETHFRALAAVAHAQAHAPPAPPGLRGAARAMPRPWAAYFVHIPHADPAQPAAGDGSLAMAVAGVVERLVDGTVRVLTGNEGGRSASAVQAPWT